MNCQSHDERARFFRVYINCLDYVLRENGTT